MDKRGQWIILIINTLWSLKVAAVAKVLNNGLPFTLINVVSYCNNYAKATVLLIPTCSTTKNHSVFELVS